MKRHVALSLGMLAVLTAVTAWAAPPAKLTYQGVLTNTSGQIVPDGAYPLAFKLYDGPAPAANTIWSGAAQQVTVSKGIFTATLAGGNPDLGTVSFDRPLFLGITVAGGVELTPRIELTAAPYSMGTNLSPGQISAVHVANRQVVKGIIVNGDTLRDEISLVGGTNVTLTPSDQGITIAATPGSAGVDSVYAGDGLVGGGSRDSITLDVLPGPGIAVIQDSLALNMPYVSARVVDEGQEDAISTAMIQDNQVVRSITVAGGTLRDDIRLIEGDNVQFTRSGQEVTIAATPGSAGVSSITAGNGLVGGGTGNVNLNVATGRGLIAYADSLALDRTFVVEEGQEASISTAMLADGAVTAAKLEPNIGPSITGLNASNLASGAVPSARLSGTYAGQLTFNNMNNNFVGNSLGLGTAPASNVTLDIRAISDSNVDAIRVINGTYGVKIRADGLHPEIAPFGKDLFINYNVANLNTCLNIDQGNVGIGTRVPREKLEVDGNICATGSISQCSDIRYKRDIEELSGTLDKVSRLRGVTYTWRTEEYPDIHFRDGRQIGVVAQEVEEIFPELVRTDADGYKSVDYAKLTPILLEAVKELNRTNEMLLARLARLESAVAALGPTARNTVGAPPAGNGHDAGEVR